MESPVSAFGLHEAAAGAGRERAGAFEFDDFHFPTVEGSDLAAFGVACSGHRGFRVRGRVILGGFEE